MRPPCAAACACVSCRPPRATRSISARTRRSTIVGQIVVEPALQHRLQHVLDEILERTCIVGQHGMRELTERAGDRRNSPDPKGAAPCPAPACGVRLDRRVRICTGCSGCGWHGEPMCGSRKSTSPDIVGSGSGPAGGSFGHKARLGAEIEHVVVDDSDGAGAWRFLHSCSACQQCAESSSGFAASLASPAFTSSSEMIRRMEARISSIDGSLGLGLRAHARSGPLDTGARNRIDDILRASISRVSAQTRRVYARPQEKSAVLLDCRSGKRGADVTQRRGCVAQRPSGVCVPQSRPLT